jgi:hypothetical protein
VNCVLCNQAACGHESRSYLTAKTAPDVQLGYVKRRLQMLYVRMRGDDDEQKHIDEVREILGSIDQ